MNVGIPGTGLGGLFYALSVVAMIVIELYLLLIGKSDPERRQLAFRQSLMLIGIVLSLVAMDFFLEKVLFAPASPLIQGVTAKAADGADALALSTTLFGIGILAIIGLSVQVLRFFFAAPKMPLASSGGPDIH